MRVLADQVASSALSSEHPQRSTRHTPNMTTNQQLINAAKWHRDVLNTTGTAHGTEHNASSLPAQSVSQTSVFQPTERGGQGVVNLDDVMQHQKRVLHHSEGFERSNYMKDQPASQEGGFFGWLRRGSLGSSSSDQSSTLDSFMQHQNRALHHSDGFERSDYMTNKQSSGNHSPPAESEGSSIFS